MVSSVLIKYGAGKPPRSPAPNRIPATLWGKLTLRFGADVERFRGIGEYKIDRGHRIYLAKDGLKIMVLLGGGSKKRQQQDIDRAVALWEDYKRRKSQMHKGR